MRRLAGCRLSQQSCGAGRRLRSWATAGASAGRGWKRCGAGSRQAADLLGWRLIRPSGTLVIERSLDDVVIVVIVLDVAILSGSDLSDDLAGDLR